MCITIHFARFVHLSQICLSTLLFQLHSLYKGKSICLFSYFLKNLMANNLNSTLVWYFCKICYHKCKSREDLAQHKKLEHLNLIEKSTQNQDQRIDPELSTMSKSSTPFQEPTKNPVKTVLLKSSDLIPTTNIKFKSTLPPKNQTQNQNIRTIVKQEKSELPLEEFICKVEELQSNSQHDPGQIDSLKMTTEPTLSSIKIETSTFDDPLNVLEEIISLPLEISQQEIVPVSKHFTFHENSQTPLPSILKLELPTKQLEMNPKYHQNVDKSKSSKFKPKPKSKQITTSIFSTEASDDLDDFILNPKIGFNGFLPKTTSNSSTVKVFKCFQCNSDHLSRDLLRQHLKIHQDGKALQCKFCNKLYFHPTSLKEHERKHTGEKPIKCQFCSESFATNKQLSDHRFKVHANMKKPTKKESRASARSKKRRQPKKDGDISVSLENATEAKSSTNCEETSPQLEVQVQLKPNSIENESSSVSMSRHIAPRIFDGKIIFVCTLCYRLHLELPAALSHVETHKGSEVKTDEESSQNTKDQIKDSVTPMTSSEPTMKKMEAPQETSECKVFERRLRTKPSSYHEEVKKFKCSLPQCGKVVTSIYNQRRHERNVHGLYTD